MHNRYTFIDRNSTRSGLFGPYCFQRRNGTIVDAALRRGVASLANPGTMNGVHGIRANAVFKTNNDGDIWIEDLGSTNGTFVHGRRLDPNVPVEVALGELIFLGSRESLRIERQLLCKLDEPASWTAPQRLTTTRVDDPDLALARTLTSSKPAGSARSARATP